MLCAVLQGGPRVLRGDECFPPRTEGGRGREEKGGHRLFKRERRKNGSKTSHADVRERC